MLEDHFWSACLDLAAAARRRDDKHMARAWLRRSRDIRSRTWPRGTINEIARLS
jgi:hypothetical protein